MASPKIKVFLVTDPGTGAPLTGIGGSLSFSYYADDQGTPIAAPAITEIGGGLYKFVPTMPASPSRGLVYVISTGGNDPLHVYDYVRPEDWNADQITDLTDAQFGHWVTVQVGPDANRLVLYRQDGVTVLKKFDLKDLSGVPTVSAPTERVPV